MKPWNRRLLFLLAIFCWLFLTAPQILHFPSAIQEAEAAISFVRSGAVTGTSFTFDIGLPGTNRLVVIIAGDESTGVNLTGASVDGKPCNLIVRANNPNGAGNHQEMWYCDEDDLGSSSGSVTVAISGGDAGWGVHAHLYTGVGQSGPTDYGIDQTSVSLTTVTVTGIDVPANGLVVMGAGEGTDLLTVNSWTSPLVQRQSEPGHPSSADLLSASGIETSQQTNKTYVATFSGTFNRGTGIVAVWPEVVECTSAFGYRKPITIDRTKVAETITVDAASSADTGTGTSSTLSWSHTVGSGNNRILIVGVSLRNNSAQTVQSVRYGGTDLTYINAATYFLGNPNAANVRAEMWYLKNPATGSNTIEITLSAAAYMVGGAASFFNVDQTTPFGNFYPGNGNSMTASVNVTSASGELVIDTLAKRNTTEAATVDPSQTQRWNDQTTNTTASNNIIGAGSTEAGAASVTMSWSFTTSRPWAIGAVSLKPSGPTNFPMLFSATDSNLATTTYGGRVTSSSGHDIIFRALDDTTCGGAGTSPCTLDHEIEKYTASTGELIAWVRIPYLNGVAASSDTVIYIYYGNSCIAGSTQNVDGVWHSSYKGVWHLHDDFLDSTSNNNDGTNSGSTNVTGKIANAQDFDGIDDYIYTANSFADLQEFTIEAWFKTNSASGKKIVGFEINQIGQSSISWDRHIWVGTDGKVYFGCYDDILDQTDQAVSTNTYTDAAWHHVVAVRNDTSDRLYLYVDGNEVNNVPNAKAESYTGYLRIGSYKLQDWTNALDGYFLGAIDEVRISNVARSAGWIQTVYNNQQWPNKAQYPSDGFITVGAEVGPAAPTAVILSSFSATEYEGKVLLHWKTGYEANNLGFNVYREEEDGQLNKINSELITGGVFLAGSNRATAGHSYIWWDTSRSEGLSAISDQSSGARREASGDNYYSSSLATRHLPLGTVRYWLEDVDLSGKKTMNGPVTPDISDEPLPEKAQAALMSQLSRQEPKKDRIARRLLVLQNRLRYTQSSRRADLVVVGVDTGDKKGALGPSTGVFSDRPGQVIGLPGYPEKKLSPQEVQWLLASLPTVKIFIQEEGWYRVTQPELIAAGLNPRVNPLHLQLYVDGEEQAMTVRVRTDGQFGPQDYIEFYGTGLDTQFTETRVYWLVAGAKPGRRVPLINGSAARAGSASFAHAVEKKPRTIYFAALKNGEASNFFGPVVSGTPVEQVLSISHLDPAPPAEATLEVSLQGATEGVHQVQIMLNGGVVGSLVFAGQNSGSVTIPVSQSLLVEGDNRVTLVALGGEMDVSLVDTVRLTYWKMYTADSDSLRFTATGGQQVWVDGFSSSQVRVVDITNPKLVQEVVGEIRQQGAGYAVQVNVPGSGQRTLLAFSPDQVKGVAAVEANEASRWYQAGWGADLVIISHGSFLESVRPLKALREAQGLSVVLIDIEDLYDEFGFGNKTAQALKDFLSRASSHWQKAPRFVLLVGDASLDSRNYMGFGSYDLVPTKLIDTAYLETASDDWFGDFNGDGLADMAVGRLPVRTVEEVQVVISKILSYEQTAPRMAEVLLVADMKGEDDLDFEAASAEVEALLPGGVTIYRIYRSQFSDDLQVRGELLGRLNAGQLVVNYLGHGSLDVWRGDVFNATDGSGLRNSPRLPFVVSMTCLNGFFQDPFMESLAEALLKAEQGGAVAVWSSSALTEPDIQAVMNQELVRLLFNGESLTIGEATKRAKAVISDLDVRKSWILFGDPTTKLKY